MEQPVELLIEEGQTPLVNAVAAASTPSTLGAASAIRNPGERRH
jgi:hypothetical protein